MLSEVVMTVRRATEGGKNRAGSNTAGVGEGDVEKGFGETSVGHGT